MSSLETCILHVQHTGVTSVVHIGCDENKQWEVVYRVGNLVKLNEKSTLISN